MRTRDVLRGALARHVPGTVVWVYGSLVRGSDKTNRGASTSCGCDRVLSEPVKPGRFHDWSDVDVALESLPSDMTLEYLPSLLSAEVGREVDVCMLDHTRLAQEITWSGERSIAWRCRFSKMGGSTTPMPCAGTLRSFRTGGPSPRTAAGLLPTTPRGTWSDSPAGAGPCLDTLRSRYGDLLA